MSEDGNKEVEMLTQELTPPATTKMETGNTRRGNRRGKSRRGNKGGASWSKKYIQMDRRQN